MTELTPAQRRTLRARAHALKPVASISQNGLSAPVLAEIDRSLKAHELIKVRVYGAERGDRAVLLTEICTRLSAAPVQQVGNILVVFRENPQDALLRPVPEPAPKMRVRPQAKARTARTSAPPAPSRRRLRK